MGKVMVYGDQKKRDMARSLLPSTMRVGTQKRVAHKRHRTTVRWGLSHDPEGETCDFGDGTLKRDVRQIVSDRRGADHTHPFEVWAEAVTKDLPPEDRLSHARALLPKGMIGDHALTHIKHREHFQHAEHHVSWRHQHILTPEEAEALRVQEHEARVKALREIVADGEAHRALNRALLRGHVTNRWVTSWVFCPKQKRDMPSAYTLVGPTRPRLLGGMGDVEAFLSDVMKASHGGSVPCEPYVEHNFMAYHECRNDQVRKERVRPGYHREWWDTLVSFLAKWRG